MVNVLTTNNKSWEFTNDGEIRMTPKFRVACIYISEMFPKNLLSGTPLTDTQLFELEMKLELSGFHISGKDIRSLVLNPFINGSGFARWKGEMIEMEIIQLRKQLIYNIKKSLENIK